MEIGIVCVTFALVGWLALVKWAADPPCRCGRPAKWYVADSIPDTGHVFAMDVWCGEPCKFALKSP